MCGNRQLALFFFTFRLLDLSRWSFGPPIVGSKIDGKPSCRSQYTPVFTTLSVHAHEQLQGILMFSMCFSVPGELHVLHTACHSSKCLYMAILLQALMLLCIGFTNVCASDTLSEHVGFAFGKYVGCVFAVLGCTLVNTDSLHQHLQEYIRVQPFTYMTGCIWHVRLPRHREATGDLHQA